MNFAVENIVFVSIVSLWEIRIKISIGRLTIPEEFFHSVTSGAFEVLGVNLTHIMAYGELPLLHRDPFDRMLLAQAKSEELTILTRDSQFYQYDNVSCMRV